MLFLTFTFPKMTFKMPGSSASWVISYLSYSLDLLCYISVYDILSYAGLQS